MAITLTHGATVYSLPPDLIWTDRFKWSAAQTSHEHSTTGALLVDGGVRLAGRPITLEGGPTHGWMPMSQAEALQELAADPAVELVLTLHDGSVFNVIFDSADTPIEAELVVDYSDPVGEHWCVPTLRFLEI